MRNHLTGRDFSVEKGNIFFLLSKYMNALHWVKSVRIRSYSGPYFPVFRLNTEVSLCIQSEWEKIRTRVTPITDSFYAVWFSQESNLNLKNALFRNSLFYCKLSFLHKSAKPSFLDNFPFLLICFIPSFILQFKKTHP